MTDHLEKLARVIWRARYAVADSWPEHAKAARRKIEQRREDNEWPGCADEAQAVLSALPSLGWCRNDWLPIESVPAAPMGVEFFYGNLVLEDQRGNSVSPLIEPYRDARRELGFWDGATWCEAGTGHAVFDRGNPSHLPTHWRELPEPPAIRATTRKGV